MEKWVVNISDEQLARLDEEQRNLGTILKSDDGKTLLVFRDGFVALKIAAQLGATRSPGRALPSAQASAHTPLARFANGDILVGEAL